MLRKWFKMSESILQIVLGTLEKLGVDTDSVEVFRELEMALPVGALETFFNIRTTSSGYVRDLGYWKIDIGSGKIVGVALDQESRELISFEDFQKRVLTPLILEEKASRQSKDSAIFRALDKVAARIITNPLEQLMPLLREVVTNIVENWVIAAPAMKKGVEYLLEKEIKELQEGLPQALAESVSMLTNLLRDLCFLAGGARKHEEANENDALQASEFLRALLDVLFEQHLGRRYRVRLIEIEKLSENIIFQAFSEWEYFARLPVRLQQPSNLMRQLLRMTRALYVAENFAEKLTDEELSILRTIKG